MAGKVEHITKNETGDLAVMSIEAYEKIGGKVKLTKLLDECLGAAKYNKVATAEDLFQRIERELA